MVPPRDHLPAVEEDADAVKGIGWALKTLGRRYPGAVAPWLVQQGSGRIINVAARAALSGVPTLGAYCASKSAVIRLTETLAGELKDHGISVNCVLPGTIDTPQNRKDMPRADFSKWVAPRAIADAILFLASDAARAVTGAALPVYGRS